MKRKSIVIASVLKTVTDTRMYEKFALSISQTKQYEVKIIGFYVKNLPNDSSIKFYPSKPFNRLSLKRIFRPYFFLLALIRLSPDKIIITTHELLLTASIYRLFTNCQLYYDVQENYYKNICHTEAFPKIFRRPLASYVRMKEWLTRPLIAHYFLAEKCYQQELKFIKNKSTIIENKSAVFLQNKYQPLQRNCLNIEIVFTGTIAKSTGIFECINLIKKLHQIDNRIRLSIIGYCALKVELKLLKTEIKNVPFISLIGGAERVPHTEIIEGIESANFGFAYYPPNPANDYCIPTKVYEYLALQIPLIISDKAHFIPIVEPYESCIKINFNNFNPEEIVHDMLTKQFYKKQPKNEVLWEPEAFKLITILNS